MIFTLGYAGLSQTSLAATLDAIGPDTLLIDVRSSPRSAKPGFNGPQLGALLGDRYRHEPGLGGRGQIDPDRLEALRAFDGPDAPSAVLMCQEELPHDCHRHHRLVWPRYPGARHIVSDCLFSPADIQAHLEGGPLPEPEGYL